MRGRGAQSRRRDGLALVAALTLTVVAAPARGQTGDAAFVNGASKAVANLAKAAPGVGSLELGVYVGTAISDVKNELAQAQAQTFDMGLIGIAATIAGCDGGDAYVRPEQLPQPTRVDNRAGDASAARNEFETGIPGFGLGHMEARATKQPLAEAVATGGTLQLGPAVTLSGGRAQATSRVVDGRAREAQASVDASIDVGGVVQLSGLRWDARHRTGADPAVDGHFDIASAAAFGIPLPLDQLAGVQEQVNAALAPLGASVQLPRVERLEEPADLVRVTPLRILFKDSPAGAAVLGPGLVASRPVRTSLFDQIVAINCQLASFLLVGDVSVSVLAGTGFLVLDIGGAEAGTAENRFVNPFGDEGRPPDGADVLPADAQAEPGGLPPPGASAGEALPAPATDEAVRVASETRCESSHPFRWPPCSRGAAVPLGVLAVLAVAGVALLDWRHQKRARS